MDNNDSNIPQIASIIAIIILVIIGAVFITSKKNSHYIPLDQQTNYYGGSYSSGE